MSQLIPCSECQRHVRLTDTACPFCNAASSAPRGNVRAGQPAPSRGLKRAAVFALSASVSVSVSACDTVAPIYGGPPSPLDSVDTSDSADTSDSVSPSPSHPSTDSSDDTGLAQPEYGAPVPPPDDTATDDTATFGDAGTTDAGAAQDGGGVDGGGADGGNDPSSGDAGSLDPDPVPTAVPLYGAPPTLE